MFKWKIRDDPSSYGGASRAANHGGAGEGITIQLLKITHFNNNTINVNKVVWQLLFHLLLLLLLLALLLHKVGRNLMHLEMFVCRDSNLRDDQIDRFQNTITRHDQAIARLDRLVDYTVSRVGD